MGGRLANHLDARGMIAQHPLHDPPIEPVTIGVDAAMADKPQVTAAIGRQQVGGVAQTSRV